jgi:zinc transporter
MVLDGAGGIRGLLDIEGAPWPPVPEPAVIVLNSADPRAAQWIADNAGLSPAERESVLGPVRRTWGSAFEHDGEKAAVLVLEAIGSSPGQEGDVGVARILASRSRLVALVDLTHPTPMLDRARVALGTGGGPRSPAEMFIDVARFWNERYVTDALELDKATAALEERTFGTAGRDQIDTLHELRRSATFLRRRMAGQRAAIACVLALEGTDLVDSHRERWRTLLRQSDEIVDLIDGIGQRLEGIDDRVQSQLSTMLGDRLYVLTLISAIFLPLSFVTGLLGVNVGGVPLRETSWAFWILCIFLIGLAFAQWWVAKRFNWLPRRDPRMKPERREQRVRLTERPQQA